MPYPTTIGGALMGYPTTVDANQVTPQLLYVPGQENNTVTGTVNAGSAYLFPYPLLAQVTVTQMRTAFSGSPTGNVDMGIYDSTGTNGGPNNLLGHTGAIAATTGLFTKSLTANLTLSQGLYWLAILDTVADTTYTRTVGAAGMGAMYKTSATNLTVLPSTIGAVADTNTFVALFALISGAFS